MSARGGAARDEMNVSSRDPPSEDHTRGAPTHRAACSRIDRGGAACRDVAGGQRRRDSTAPSAATIRASTDAVPSRPHSITRPSRTESAIPSPTPTAASRTVCEDGQLHHVRPRRAERDPDANLVRALRDHVGHDAVDAAGRQHEGERPEHAHHHRDVLQPQRALAERGAQRHHVIDRLGGVHGANCGARSAGERRRIAGCPHRQAVVSRRRLGRAVAWGSRGG